MTDSNGKPRWFASIEEFDPKTKSLRVVDPLAEKLKEMKAKQDILRQSGASEDQLDSFYLANIKPFTPSKRYYVSVMTQNNEIGTLSLPITAFQGLKQLAQEYNGKGVDITGMRGLFLNFKRTKGARKVDVSYSVDVYRETVNMAGEMVEKPKIHELTPDIINRLGNETEDLTALFIYPSKEDLTLLAAAPAEHRGLVVDRIVGKSETVSKEEPTMNVSIAGTNAVAVPRVEVTSTGDLDVVLPNIQAQSVIPTIGHAADHMSTPKISAAHANNSLSDDEFHKIFSQSKK